MAAWTHRASTASTANAATYTSDAFTPAQGDLLVGICYASATLDVATLDVNANGVTSFALVTSAVRGTADTIYLFVAEQFVGASPSSMTVTFNCTGDNATGNITWIGSLSGMSRVGAAAV